MAIESVKGGWTYSERHDIRDIYKKAMAGEPLPSGLSDLESQIKKLSNTLDIEEVIWRRASRDHGREIIVRFDSLLKIDITDEERQAAVEFADQRIHIGGIGYVDPSRIISYYCGKCDEEYEGPPKIEVYISDETDKFDEYQIKIGSVLGECKTCAEPVISACPVWEGQTPDVKYIAKDYSGKFIKPTTDSIEEILKDAAEAAEKGKFDVRSTKIAQRWAEIIGYDLGNKIKDLEDLAPKQDLQIYEQNLESTVDEIRDHMRNWLDDTLHVREYDGEISDGDQFFLEKFEGLLKYLPKIKVPENPELREKIKFILDSYRKDLEADKAKLEKRVSELNVSINALPKI